MRLLVIGSALGLALALPAQARESIPVHVKVSGFVQSSCRIEIRGTDTVMQPGCNVPWSVAMVPGEPAGAERLGSGKKSVSRVTVRPAV